MSTSPTTADRHGAIAWMAGNSVAANLLMLVLIAGGILWSMRIKQEVFPEFDLDRVTISVAYPGASPTEVEQGVILAVEEAVRGLDAVEEISSSAAEGAGHVFVDILLGEDVNKAAQDIQSEVDRIRSFPEDIEEPEVTIVSRRRQVLSVVLYGDQDERILREFAEQVRDRFVQDPEITQVELSAVRPLEIGIEVPQECLRAYGLTLDDVARKVREAAVEVPGGGIKTSGGEILVRMKERRDYGNEFADIPILTSNDGTRLLLGDIATINDGFEDTDQSAWYNGHPAVMVGVYRVGNETPVGVSEAVHRHTRELEQILPEGIGLEVWNDMSDIYQQRMDLLLRNGYLGLTLVFVLLALFLEARLAFWVTMGIPISFLGTVLLLPLMGVSINMVSLFAFIIALGIVVDDAIIVGENVYEWRRQGLPFLQAAVRGAREVVQPVTFSILTNIAAFMPLFFVPGVMGKIFRVIPAVVVLVFLMSLLECLFVLPAHLGHQKDFRAGGIRRWVHGCQKRFSEWFSRMIRERYGPLLRKALEYRYVTLAVGLSLLMLTAAYVSSGRMGMTMFPRVESDLALATAVLPYGTAVEVTEQVQADLMRAAEEIIDEHGGDTLVEGILAEIGGSTAEGGPISQGGGGASGGHTTTVRVFLTPPDQRPLGTAEFVKLWRERVGSIPGLESLAFRSDTGGPGGGAALTVELSHPKLETLEQAGAELAEVIRTFPNARDVDDGFTPGKRQFDFRILPTGQSLGLSASDVARQVRNAYYGAEVVRQQRGRNEVKIMVRLPEAERVSEHDLEELLIRAPSGADLPLREVVTVSRGRAYTTIDRRQGRRVITVTADVDPPSQAGMILAALKADTLPEMLTKYPGLRYGFEGRQAEMAESLDSLKMGFVLAMMVIYAILAVPFRSYVQPLIVMTSIPFGFIGAVLGHLIMGYSLSIVSMMGMVALAGVVVNDSLVLIEFANREYRAGKSRLESIIAAGLRRFRPITLTSLTTFGGLAPMILETSRQARFLIPMALSLAFGIIFATGVVLLLVPALFIIVEDLRVVLHLKEAERDEPELIEPVRA